MLHTEFCTVCNEEFCSDCGDHEECDICCGSVCKCCIQNGFLDCEACDGKVCKNCYEKHLIECETVEDDEEKPNGMAKD